MTPTYSRRIQLLCESMEMKRSLKASVMIVIMACWCGMVGWAGVSAIVGYVLVKISDAGLVRVSYDVGFLIALTVGGLGGYTFLKIGLGWADHKWAGDKGSSAGPKEENQKAG